MPVVAPLPLLPSPSLPAAGSRRAGVAHTMSKQSSGGSPPAGGVATSGPRDRRRPPRSLAARPTADTVGGAGLAADATVRRRDAAAAAAAARGRGARPAAVATAQPCAAAVACPPLPTAMGVANAMAGGEGAPRGVGGGGGRGWQRQGQVGTRGGRPQLKERAAAEPPRVTDDRVDASPGGCTVALPRADKRAAAPAWVVAEQGEDLDVQTGRMERRGGDRLVVGRALLHACWTRTLHVRPRASTPPWFSLTTFDFWPAKIGVDHCSSQRSAPITGVPLFHAPSRCCRRLPPSPRPTSRPARSAGAAAKMGDGRSGGAAHVGWRG